MNRMEGTTESSYENEQSVDENDKSDDKSEEEMNSDEVSILFQKDLLDL